MSLINNYRIAKVCGVVYQNLIRRHYRINPHLASLSYQEHKSEIKRFFPTHVNSFPHYMNNLGHCCEEFIYDLQSLQQSWALENGYDYGEHSWTIDILLQQLKDFQPEILYLQDVHGLPHCLRKEIKKLIPSIQKVIIFKGFPGRPEELHDIDLILAGTPLICREYAKYHDNVKLFYHSFDPLIIKELEKRNSTTEKKYNFTFLGYSGYGGYGSNHLDRFQMLRSLVKETDLQMWTEEDQNYQVSQLKIEEQPLSNQFPKQVYEGKLGLNMYQTLQNSLVTFNKHTEAAGTVIGNMRLFEATGVGTCLLTDTGDNMNSLFEENSEVVVYNNLHECKEKLKFLLENESTRRNIAKAGMSRTLKDHSLENRCSELNQYLEELS